MRFIKVLFLFLFPIFVIGQDCVNYWKFNDDYISTSYNYKNNYFIVPEGCFSKLISTSEHIEIYFDLIQERDYKITIGSEYNLGKPIIKIYNIEDNQLLYDNTTIDTISSIEFEIEVTRKVKAIISLPSGGTLVKKDKNQYYSNIFTPKILRYCTGIKLETMVTRK